MAKLIPQKFYGENQQVKNLFELIKRTIGNDYWVKYNENIEKKEHQFIIIGPAVGVLVLKVMDVSIDEIEIDAFISHTRDDLLYPIKEIKMLLQVTENEFKERYNHVTTSNIMFKHESHEVMLSYSTKLLNKLTEKCSGKTVDFDENDMSLIRLMLEPDLLIKDKQLKIMTEDQETLSNAIPVENTMYVGGTNAGKSTLLEKQIQYILKSTNDKKILTVNFTYEHPCVTTYTSDLVPEVFDYVFVDHLEKTEQDILYPLAYDETVFIMAHNGSQSTEKPLMFNEDLHIKISQENIHLLSHNFYASENIIQFADALLEVCHLGQDHNVLYSKYIPRMKARNKKGGIVKVNKYRDAQDLMSKMMNEFCHLIDDGVSFDDIAFYGLTQEVITQLKHELKLHGIPFDETNTKKNHVQLLTTKHVTRIRKSYVYIVGLDDLKKLQKNILEVYNVILNCEQYLSLHCLVTSEFYPLFDKTTDLCDFKNETMVYERLHLNDKDLEALFEVAKYVYKLIYKDIRLLIKAVKPFAGVSSFIEESIQTYKETLDDDKLEEIQKDLETKDLEIKRLEALLSKQAKPKMDDTLIEVIQEKNEINEQLKRKLSVQKIIMGVAVVVLAVGLGYQMSLNKVKAEPTLENSLPVITKVDQVAEVDELPEEKQVLLTDFTLKSPLEKVAEFSIDGFGNKYIKSCYIDLIQTNGQKTRFSGAFEVNSQFIVEKGEDDFLLTVHDYTREGEFLGTKMYRINEDTRMVFSNVFVHFTKINDLSDYRINQLYFDTNSKAVINFYVDDLEIKYKEHLLEKIESVN